MRKISKLQKKLQNTTNHQTKKYVLNQIEEIENLKVSINTERNLKSTRAIKYAKNLFGHPQANTLSDINITREDITDVISLKSFMEALIDFQQYFSNNGARAKPTLSNFCIKLQ